MWRMQARAVVSIAMRSSRVQLARCVSVATTTTTTTASRSSIFPASRDARLFSTSTSFSTTSTSGDNSRNAHGDRSIRSTLKSLQLDRIQGIKNRQQYAQLVEAMRIFYEHYQHFVVPRDFKVPHAPASGDSVVESNADNDDAAWPAHLGGMKLGYALRRLIRHLNSDKNDRKSVLTQRAAAEITEELHALGFPVEARDWPRFQFEQTTLSALKTFKAQHEHVRVPNAFVVPSGDVTWPRPTWGFKLGTNVNYLRTHRGRLDLYQHRALDALGFVWNVNDDNWARQITPSLQTFREVFGHCDVSKAFVVPHEVPWPDAAWGMNLGSVVHNMRSHGYYSEQVERDTDQLDALGFVWSSLEFKWSECILPSLQTFRDVYGHCDVSRAFVVPHETPWPTPAWGMNLGYVVQNMRSHGSYAEQVERDADQLEDLGFVWSSSATKWNECILPSLQKFREVFGHCDVSATFVVPCIEPWPTPAWGMNLGYVVHSMRSRGDYTEQVERDAELLEDLGFVWNALEYKWSKSILPSLQTFRDVYGHCEVSQTFVVPHKTPWPTPAWGLNLGSVVYNMRYRGDHSEFASRDAEQLDALGFVWSTLEFKWRQHILPALKMFVHVHGHAAISRTFVVPHEAPWQEASWGLELGRVTWDARYQHWYGEYIESERSQLEALGYSWPIADASGSGSS